MKLMVCAVLIFLSSSIAFGQGNSASFKEAGLELFEKGSYKEALLKFNQAVEADSFDYQAFYMRGNAKKIFEDYHGAMKDYNIALDINPAFQEAYFERGNVKYELQDYYGAIKDLSEVIKINENNVNAYLRRGQARQQLEAFQDAINDCTKILEIHPKSVDAYYLRGVLRIEHGLLLEGCLDLSKAGELGDLKSYEIIRDICNQKTLK